MLCYKKDKELQPEIQLTTERILLRGKHKILMKIKVNGFREAKITVVKIINFYLNQSLMCYKNLNGADFI